MHSTVRNDEKNRDRFIMEWKEVEIEYIIVIEITHDVMPMYLLYNGQRVNLISKFKIFRDFNM